MTATSQVRSDASAASEPENWFDFAVIDERATELGIEGEVALAEFLEMNRSSLYRFRKRELQPSLPTAMRVAERLGFTVEKVIGQRGAES